MRPLVEITWIDAALHDRAFRRLELRHQRTLSLADCASFVVMEDLSIAAAFAYDPDFEREGFATVTRPEHVT